MASKSNDLGLAMADHVGLVPDSDCALYTYVGLLRIDPVDGPTARQSMLLGKAIFAVLVVVVFAAAVCAGGDVIAGNPGGDAISEQSIERVLYDNSEALLAIPGVVGAAVGLCEGNTCIKVLVVEHTSGVESAVREVLPNGSSVVIVESGEFRALPAKEN